MSARMPSCYLDVRALVDGSDTAFAIAAGESGPANHCRTPEGVDDNM
jgi:hypothetical protein